MFFCGEGHTWQISGVTLDTALTPKDAWRPNGIPGIEPGLATYTTSILLTKPH